MIPTTVKQIVEATGGTLLSGAAESIITGVSTNSRTIAQGHLFVPLIAARDGHEFIADALRCGAGCLCSRVPAKMRPDRFYIRVEDTRLAMKALASWYRGCFAIPFIQITGSVGKTTTKEMIAAVLGERFRVLKTAENFNNDIGVPQTLFQLAPEHQIAVIETGMNHFGEIRYLGEMVRPQVAVISNVGDAHIEFLGSRAGILKAKSEIFEHLDPAGFAVLNGDDELLNTVSLPQTIYRCGMGNVCSVRVDEVCDHGVEGVSCCVQTQKERYYLDIPAPGVHMVYSAAMAVLIGEKFGMGKEEIQRGVAHFEPTGERMKIYRRADGAMLLSDCYNANPQSMAAAIETLCAGQSGENRKKIAVLGDMGELGDLSERAHYQTGKLCGQKGVDTVIAIGEKASAIAAGARDGGVSAVLHFATADDAKETLNKTVQGDCVVLLKASHAMQFPKIVSELTDN